MDTFESLSHSVRERNYHVVSNNILASGQPPQFRPARRPGIRKIVRVMIASVFAVIEVPRSASAGDWARGG